MLCRMAYIYVSHAAQHNFRRSSLVPSMNKNVSQLVCCTVARDLKWCTYSKINSMIKLVLLATEWLVSCSPWSVLPVIRTKNTEFQSADWNMSVKLVSVVFRFVFSVEYRFPSVVYQVNWRSVITKIDLILTYEVIFKVKFKVKGRGAPKHQKRLFQSWK